MSSEVRGLLFSMLTAVAGAITGGVVKWLLDRSKINNMKLLIEQAQKDREEARQDRQSAIDAREAALQEREQALRDLARREAESEERQRRLHELQRTIDEKGTDIGAKQTKLDRLLQTLKGTETGIWSTFPRSPPFDNYDARISRRRPIIITVSNNKGGVGKTTIVGNLLAYFDQSRKARVLAIDLDYQGSLSTLLRSERNEQLEERNSSVNVLLSRSAGLGSLWEATRRLGDRLPRSELAPAFYELALLEDRLLVEWLLQQSDGDVRYRLAQVLLQDAIADKFDVVLIDVPPRLTTGTINALCASSHVLVPTIFNPIAAEPVSNFIATTMQLMDVLNPKLQFLGVVETMAPRANEGQAARAEGRRVISEALQNINPNLTILNSSIPRRTAIAEGGIAFLDDRDSQKLFKSLGDEICKKVGL